MCEAGGLAEEREGAPGLHLFLFFSFLGGGRGWVSGSVGGGVRL